MKQTELILTNKTAHGKVVDKYREKAEAIKVIGAGFFDHIEVVLGL
jgi:hypothetical protein